MTDEGEFAARSQLKWAREDDAWILLHRRRRMGRVVPDTDHPRMWRSVKVDGLLAACGTPSAVLVEWEPPKSTKAPLGRSQLSSRRFHLP